MLDTTLIQHLQNPALYPHPVHECKLIETHISWVILTGDYVYKIKKPVDFEFLNYTTLAKRKFYCAEELRLNQALAKDIYLDVVPITGSTTDPSINGNGPVIEYALKMREFSQENLFTELLKQKLLTTKHFLQIAETLAHFHLNTNRDCPTGIGTPQQVHEPVKQNFDQIRPFLTAKKDLDTLAKLETWANTQHQQLHAIFNARKQDGFIRECHGDVHLGNITLYDNQPVIFDCIEFNIPFRWTDVMADVGFLLMDLHDHQQDQFAHCFLNHYLEQSGDYQGLAILPYYQAYRAMVRAKVSLFDRMQAKDEAKKQALKQRYDNLVHLAETYAQPQKPFLAITHGVAGVGKSTVAKLIVAEYGAIQIRSDVIRKRLAELELNANTHSALNQGLYAAEAMQKTYAQLLNLAENILAAGYNVIVDATFLKHTWREEFAQLAAQLNTPFVILHCHAPTETIIEWLAQRRQQSGEVSEASKEVLLMQLERIEALTPDELNHIISIDTAANIDVDQIKMELDKLV